MNRNLQKRSRQKKKKKERQYLYFKTNKQTKKDGIIPFTKNKIK